MKDLRDLTRLGAEASEGWDPVEQMRAATAQMERAAAQSRLLASGTTGTATVVAVRDTRTSVNRLPIIQVELLVIAEGRVPWPATASNVGHANLAVLRPGASIAVRYDPTDPSIVAIV